MKLDIYDIVLILLVVIFAIGLLISSFAKDKESIGLCKDGVGNKMIGTECLNTEIDYNDPVTILGLGLMIIALLLGVIFLMII